MNDWLLTPSRREDPEIVVRVSDFLPLENNTVHQPPKASLLKYICACVRACVRARVRARVRACVRACARLCVCVCVCVFVCVSVNTKYINSNIGTYSKRIWSVF